MKKLIVFLSGALLTTSLMAGAVTNTATWNVPWGDAWRSRAETTLDRMATKINADDKDVVVDSAIVNGPVTINGGTFDWNGANTNNHILISATNTAGRDGRGLIEIEDAVTGTFGNDTNEPAFRLTTARTYALAILEGLIYCKDGFEGPGSALTDLSAASVTAGGAFPAVNLVNATNVQAASALVGVVPEVNGGAGAASGILKANGAGLVSAATAETDYLTPASVWGKPSMVSGIIATTNGVVEVTALYIDGSANADYRMLRFWITDTLGGAASTNNIEAFTLTDGTAIETVTANADYIYVTTSTGTNTVIIDVQGADTHYLYGSDGGSVTNIEMIFAGP